MNDICAWLRAVRGVRAYSKNLDVQTAQLTRINGWMTKKGTQELDGTLFDLVTNRKGDKIRWVVLKGNGELIYYKDNRTNHPQNRFQLEPGSVTVDRSLDPISGSPRTRKDLYLIKFEIRKSSRTWLMGVETEELRNKWLVALKQWLRQ